MRTEVRAYKSIERRGMEGGRIDEGIGEVYITILVGKGTKSYFSISQVWTRMCSFLFSE